MFLIYSKIRRINNEWVVLSEKGKILGRYPTKEQAVKRLRQIEFFKHKKGSFHNYSFWIRTADEQLDLAKKIAHILFDAGYEVFFVGGAVRDLILNRPPADYDLVTSAPIEVIEKLLNNNGFVAKAFPRHHVVTVYDPKTKIKTDVAEYRKDIHMTGRQSESQSQRAESLFEDLKRRDFTIGAMAKNVISGEIIDPFGGMEDLKNKVLRTVGDPYQRFAEDLLRILRGLRFAATFDLTIEPTTKEAMRALGPKIPEFIPPERIMGELVKIMDRNVLSKFIRLADEVGILKYLNLSALEKLKGLEHGEYHQEDPFTHTLLVLENLEKMEGVSKEVLLAGLFHDIGKALTYTKNPETGKVTFYDHAEVGANLAKEILQQLRFDSKTIDTVVQLIQSHMRLHTETISDKALRKLYREFQGHLEPLLQLTKADSRGRIGPHLYDNLDEIEQRLKTLTVEQPKFDPLLSGLEIMNLLGISGGPLVGKIKNEILEKQFSGELTTKEDAKAYVLENAERLKQMASLSNHSFVNTPLNPSVSEIYIKWLYPSTLSISKFDLMDPEVRNQWVEGWGRKHKKKEEPELLPDVAENIQLDTSHPITE